jgi:tetratricopeptide (TPR) repeat protein
VIDTATLLQQVLTARNKEERQALLEAHRPLETAFFQLLKERVRALIEENSREALRVADVGLEAAEYAAEQEGVACAWWARGNALLSLVQPDACLAAFSTAISILANLGRVGEVAQLQTNCMLPLMWTGRMSEAQAMGRSALDVLAGQGDTKPLANLLLSLGACARRLGDHAGALAYAQQAAAIFTRLGDAGQVARCWITQAVALEQLDRFSASEDLLRQALAVLAGQGKWADWARAALNVGILRARLADHQAALHWMEESRRAFLDAGVEADAAVADLYRAQSFLDVNLLPEAAMLSEELVETFARLQMVRQVARAALLLAEACALRGQANPARRELERARQIFRVQGDAIEVALVDLRRAALLREAGRPGEALRLASEAASALDVRRYPLRHAESHLLVAACCEDLGRIEEAQVAYRVAWAAGSHPTGATEPPPALAYRIAHARGAIAEAAGARALARGEYGRAVGYLQRIAQGLGLDELRGGYLTDKRPVYEAALRLALDDGRLADAFRYSELARAGTLRDCLAGRRRPAPEAGSADDVMLEELKARWAWRASGLRRPVDLLAETEKEAGRSGEQSTALRELADLERELADAYRRRRLADPSLAALEQGEVLGPDEVRRALSGDTALLSFDHVNGRLLAFVVTRDRVDVAWLGELAQLRWDAAGLGHALEEVRLFDDPADLALLEAELLEDLQALYRDVLRQPLSRVGVDVRRLLIVPCDVLHVLPLEACHDGQRYLLERYAVTYLPSASLLAALPESRQAGVGSPLILAHSWDGRLPLALEEAERVAQTLADGTGQQPVLLAEEQATARALRERARMAGVVHIAAHGAFRTDAPLFSTLHLADGPFTVNEVYGLDLSRTALVTLSGCQTGLVQDFYAALVQGETVAEAMRQAQLATLACRPHAGYWAAFAVWGRGFDLVA